MAANVAIVKLNGQKFLCSKTEKIWIIKMALQTSFLKFSSWEEVSI